MAVGVVDKFSMLYMTGSIPEKSVVTAYFLNFIIYALVTVILWFFAPVFAKKLSANIPENNNQNLENVNTICAAILIAAGFLILSKSFHYYSYWIGNLLNPNNNSVSIDVRSLITSLAYTFLGGLLIFTPKGIIGGINCLKNYGAIALQELKK
jgi:membrane-anchored protein YejM (alkaline phosphatase superfamily)